MFHSRKMENRINKIHKKALKLVYHDSYDFTFQELLATEMFKSKHGVSPELMNDIIYFLDKPYNLITNYTLKRKRDHTVYHVSEILSSLAPKLRIFYQTQ